MRTGTNKFTAQSWALSAGCCFAGGIGSGFIGSVLTSLGWITGAEVHPYFRGVGTLLLILTIPLLVLAGHCLDRFERGTKNFSLPTAHSEVRQELSTRSVSGLSADALASTAYATENHRVRIRL